MGRKVAGLAGTRVLPPAAIGSQNFSTHKAYRSCVPGQDHTPLICTTRFATARVKCIYHITCSTICVTLIHITYYVSQSCRSAQDGALPLTPCYHWLDEGGPLVCWMRALQPQGPNRHMIKSMTVRNPLFPQTAPESFGATNTTTITTTYLRHLAARSRSSAAPST